ncbi:MAG: hypothetical protein ACFE9C_14870 [Candidatus Hodarchaeota archaeon]
MAVTEVKNNININTSKVEFICPVCKSKKLLKVPNSIIAEAKQLTTMSIAKGLVCEHQFQAFVDKQFQVRGYQRVDFEFENNLNHKKNPNSKNPHQKDNDLFENLILEGNYVEYRPKISKNNNPKCKIEQNFTSKKRKLTLKEIYNEFWEFIEEDNEKFRDLINKDYRRSQI